MMTRAQLALLVSVCVMAALAGPPATAADADAFWAFMHAVDRLAEQGQHREALSALEKARARYPDRSFEIDSEVAAAHARLGEIDESMAIWRKGQAEGFFFGLFPDFAWLKPFENVPGFREIARRDQEMRDEATRVARMRYEIVMPARYVASRKYPLFIVLHAGFDSIEQARTYWRSPRLGEEYLVAYLQSYRKMSSTLYSWQGSDELARRGVRTLYDEIRQKYPIDSSRVLIGGMSAGGMMSLDVVFHDVIPATGFVVNCPVVPADFETAMADGVRSRGIRGVVITGEKDWGLARQREMVDAFAKAGVAHQFTVVPGIGHEIPEDFGARLDAALSYLSPESGEPRASTGIVERGHSASTEERVKNARPYPPGDPRQ